MKRKNYTSEQFKKYCKDNEKAWFAGAIIVAIISLCGFLVPIDYAVNGRGNWADGVLGGIELLTVALSFNFISRIFRSMKRVGSPFSYDIADKIMGLAKIIEIGSLVCFVGSIIIKAAGYKELIAESTCIEPGIFFILGFAVSIFFESLARTYDYGAELQQQADETL